MSKKVIKKNAAAKVEVSKKPQPAAPKKTIPPKPASVTTKPVAPKNTTIKKTTKNIKPTEEEIVCSDIIEEEFSYCEPEKKTTPYMSQYEYCALISARVAQLTSRSAEWNLPKIRLESPDDYDPLKIATKEIHARLVSLVIRRKLPDGTTEDWPVKDMIFPRI